MKRSFARSVCTLSACAPLLALAGCGGANPSGERAANGTAVPSSAVTTVTNAEGVFTVPETGTITTSQIPPGQPVRGDADADNPGDIDGSGDSDSARVGGADTDSDYPVPSSYRFPDGDDASTFAYGRVPAPGVRRAIEAVVGRYFAAAARSDGRTACTLLPASLVRTAPQSFAGPTAPPYLRGQRSCAGVLSLMFAHEHGELAAPVRIAAVRVSGASARAIVASATLRASSIYLQNEAGAWRLQEVFSQPLP